MKTFSVHCEYPAFYRIEVTVEAEDSVDACRTALAAANASDGWTALDWEQPAHVTAITEGTGIDPWRRTPDGAEPSILPVPGPFT